jgi:hypothetical protein
VSHSFMPATLILSVCIVHRLQQCPGNRGSL